jgi:peptidylprolyl isomerase
MRLFLLFIISLLCNVFIPENAMAADTIVCLETTQGTIELKLFTEIAPLACENFVTLSENHYYDGTIFHRVIKGFMIQGGDPSKTGANGQSAFGKSFRDECLIDVYFNKKGILAMANRGPNTNGSQFFITTAPTPWLNMHHTIFGEVIQGYDVVEKIEKTKTDMRDRPVEEQVIIKAYIKKN